MSFLQSHHLQINHHPQLRIHFGDFLGFKSLNFHHNHDAAYHF